MKKIKQKLPNSIGIQLSLLFITFVLFAVIPSCTFRGIKHLTYLTDERFPPKPASAPVEIIVEIPSRPYILIGEVSASADVKFPKQPDPQNAIDKIKTMAREMGGDAIIGYQGYRAPAGTVGAGGFTAQGKVIRWK